MKIEVVNWEKYNPRTDAKAWSWFRMQNDFFEDEDLFDLGMTELVCFVYVCCLRSKAGDQTIFKMNPRQMAQKCRCTLSEAVAAVDALEAIGKIIVHERRPDPNADVRARTDSHADVRERTHANVDVPIRPDPYPTNETDVTNVTNGTDILSPPKLNGKPRARTRKESLTPTFSASDLSVGREWLNLALSEMPWKLDDPSWTAERFAEHLAKLRRATGVTEAGLVEILAYVAKDEFWRKNACSPAGLLSRSSRNGERKIDNILVRMRTKQDRTMDTLKEWAEENYEQS